jgi:hypothetical protein
MNLQTSGQKTRTYRGKEEIFSYMGHSPILLAWKGAMLKMIKCSQHHINTSKLPPSALDINSGYGDRLMLWHSMSGWKNLYFVEDTDYNAHHIFARFYMRGGVNITRELTDVPTSTNLQTVFCPVLNGPIGVNYALSATNCHMGKSGVILIMFVDYDKLHKMGNISYKNLIRIQIHNSTFCIETVGGTVFSGISVKKDYVINKCDQYDLLRLEHMSSGLDLVLEFRKTLSPTPALMEPHVRWFLSLFTFVRVRKL